MKIQTDEHDGVTVLRVIGHLDSNTTPEFEEQLFRIIDARGRRILIDLAEVDFLGSVALRTFLLAARKLAPSGGELSVCGPNEAVRDTLDASGFSKLFGVFETRQEALARS
ncbi:MAG: STAS domain-containing protein [Planctomycetota bacterium]|jgi:anti-anti-sigma factor